MLHLGDVEPLLLGAQRDEVGRPATHADPQVAVQKIAGDKSSQMYGSIVDIVGRSGWQVAKSEDGAAAVINGQLVKKKGHAAHLRVKVQKGATVVADIDLRVGRKAKLDAKKRSQLAKRLAAALDTLKREATAEAAPEPKPIPRRPAVQAIDDELPPGFRR